MVGLILPADDPRIGLASGTAGSPFVLAFSSVGIKVLPSIINAVVITSAFVSRSTCPSKAQADPIASQSSGNGVLFLASRTLLGLSAQKKAPKIFLRTNRFGCPYVAVAFCSLLMPLAYLVLGNSTANQVFNWLVNIIAVSGLMMWCAICVGYLRFYYGMRARGISRDELPYKAPLQPYAACESMLSFLKCLPSRPEAGRSGLSLLSSRELTFSFRFFPGFAGIVCFLVVFFSGFAVFFPGNFSAANFLSNYVSRCAHLAISPALTLRPSPDLGLHLHRHLHRYQLPVGMEVQVVRGDGLQRDGRHPGGEGMERGQPEAEDELVQVAGREGHG